MFLEQEAFILLTTVVIVHDKFNFHCALCSILTQVNDRNIRFKMFNHCKQRRPS